MFLGRKITAEQRRKEGLRMSKIYTSADQLIGGTPLLELSHIEAKEGVKARILAKL